MSATDLETWDRSVHTTNIWLKEINEQLGPDRRPMAWHVLGVVLRALRDRLRPEDAANLSAQLPLIVCGAFYEQYRPSIQPEPIISREAFLEKIAAGLEDIRPVDPEDAARAVFAVLSRHLPERQIEKTREVLPEKIRSLWPAS